MEVGFVARCSTPPPQPPNSDPATSCHRTVALASHYPSSTSHMLWRTIRGGPFGTPELGGGVVYTSVSVFDPCGNCSRCLVTRCRLASQCEILRWAAGVQAAKQSTSGVAARHAVGHRVTKGGGPVSMTLVVISQLGSVGSSRRCGGGSSCVVGRVHALRAAIKIICVQGAYLESDPLQKRRRRMECRQRQAADQRGASWPVDNWRRRFQGQTRRSLQTLSPLHLSHCWPTATRGPLQKWSSESMPGTLARCETSAWRCIRGTGTPRPHRPPTRRHCQLSSSSSRTGKPGTLSATRMSLSKQFSGARRCSTRGSQRGGHARRSSASAEHTANPPARQRRAAVSSLGTRHRRLPLLPFSNPNSASLWQSASQEIIQASASIADAEVRPIPSERSR